MKNAPLAEIICEVRWGDGRSGQDPSIILGGDESTFVRLGIELGKDGFDNLERLLPSGFPVQAGQVLYRYRSGSAQQNVLYQAGTGVFTANGLPPYSSWDDFAPVLLRGAQALFAVAPFERGQPFELVVRYIDAFSESALAGISQLDFIEKIVGVNYIPTKAALQFSKDAMLKSVRFNAVHVASNGAKVVLDVGQGSIEGREAIVMHTVAHSAPVVPGSPDELVQNLGELKATLHGIFFEMIGRNAGVEKALKG